MTEQVTHPAVTHEEPVYETQTKVVKEAWDEPVYQTKIVSIATGKWFNTVDEWDAWVAKEFEPNHPGYDDSYTTKDVLVDTIHHPEEIETSQVQVGSKTVTDKEAYTETIEREVCE